MSEVAAGLAPLIVTRAAQTLPLLLVAVAVIVCLPLVSEVASMLAVQVVVPAAGRGPPWSRLTADHRWFLAEVRSPGALSGLDADPTLPDQLRAAVSPLFFGWSPVVAWADNSAGAFDVYAQVVGVDAVAVNVSAPGKTVAPGDPARVVTREVCEPARHIRQTWRYGGLGAQGNELVKVSGRREPAGGAVAKTGC